MVSVERSSALNVSAKAVRKKEICRHIKKDKTKTRRNEMSTSNNKHWSGGSAAADAKIYPNGGQYSSNTASKKSAMSVLKGNYRIARRVVSKRSLTATQRKQQQQERQLQWQGFEQEEIDDVLGFLDWLNKDEEHEKDMMEWFPVADESEPFHLSILAQKAIKAEAEAEAGRML